MSNERTRTVTWEDPKALAQAAEGLSGLEFLKKIVAGGWLGELNHFVGEAYGPVVVKKKQGTWRANPEEGGGCLLDYAVL